MRFWVSWTQNDSIPDSEVRERFFHIYRTYNNVCYSRHGGPNSKIIGKSDDQFAVALYHHQNTAIGSVSYPAFQVKKVCLLLRKVPESHTLNPTFDTNFELKHFDC